ncbi:hypothetical protein EDB87DRAFT_1574704 [Lactarius vividus]|nr:hypothetical protein EDB87DRAFT_1574704 [Lactarius vividus]
MGDPRAYHKFISQITSERPDVRPTGKTQHRQIHIGFKEYGGKAEVHRQEIEGITIRVPPGTQADKRQRRCVPRVCISNDYVLRTATIGKRSAPGGASAPDGYSASSDEHRLLTHLHPKAHWASKSLEWNQGCSAQPEPVTGVKIQRQPNERKLDDGKATAWWGKAVDTKVKPQLNGYALLFIPWVISCHEMERHIRTFAMPPHGVLVVEEERSSCFTVTGPRAHHPTSALS